MRRHTHIRTYVRTSKLCFGLSAKPSTTLHYASLRYVSLREQVWARRRRERRARGPVTKRNKTETPGLFCLAPLLPLYIRVSKHPSVAFVSYRNSSQSNTAPFQASKCLGKMTVLGVLRPFTRPKTPFSREKGPQLPLKRAQKQLKTT